MDQQRQRIRPIWVDWDTVDVLLNGSSAIDIPRLHVTDIDAADGFLRSYGYDLSNPEESDEAQGILADAKQFAADVLGPDPEYRRRPLRMPREIADVTDVRQLMVMSSIRTGDIQIWACALLRLMHAITHVNNHFSRFFYPQIKEQIITHITSYIHQEEGRIELGVAPWAVELYNYEIKDQKPFESSILKLLHKVDNIGATIFDRIGVRLVTRTRLDALMAAKFMLDQHLVSYPNVLPTRSRNTLFNDQHIRGEIDRLLPLYNKGEISLAELRTLAEMTVNGEQAQPRVRPELLKERNAFSSTAYRSIQFTVRHLIRVQMPGVEDPLTGAELRPSQPFRFFFPYEVQILDKDSYEESRRGRASHEEYRRSQIVVARKRIFGALLEG